MVGDFDEEAQRRAGKSRNTLSYWEILLILISKIEERHCDREDDIPILDVYSVDPWQLPEVGCSDGEPRFYFCCPPEGAKAYNCREGPPSRTTPSGLWKAESTPSYILLDDSSRFPSGMKNTLVFYHGQDQEPSSATKTMWLMNEYVAFQRTSDGAVVVPLTATREMSICQVYNAEATVIPSDRSTAADGCDLADQLLAELGDDGGNGAEKQCQIPWRDGSAENKVEIRQMVVPRENAAEKQQDYSGGRSICRKRMEKSSNCRRELTRRPGDDDGYSWRKYGQNKVIGCKYPRSYYRCALRYKIASGRCRATKTVQQVESTTDGGTRLYQVVYYREHICVPPPKTPPIAYKRRASEADDVEVQLDDGS